jgi:hypothetical protein
METEIILGALFIFVLRVLGVAISTIRVLLMTRGLKLASAVLGFVEVLVYALAIGKVVQDLTNIPFLLSYCFGFSVGTLLGMRLEEQLAIGFATIRPPARCGGRQCHHLSGRARCVRDGGGDAQGRARLHARGPPRPLEAKIDGKEPTYSNRAGTDLRVEAHGKRKPGFAVENTKPGYVIPVPNLGQPKHPGIRLKPNS